MHLFNYSDFDSLVSDGLNIKFGITPLLYPNVLKSRERSKSDNITILKQRV